MIMASMVQVSVTSRWSFTHLFMFFLWMCAFLHGGNALVPVATAQKGFVPSFAWFDGTPNTTAVQEKPQ